MKTLLSNISLYTLCLFLLEQLIPGVAINGGLNILLVGGVALTVLFMLLKPILNIISFPVNLVTLGVFNIFINAMLVYLLTVFVTEISITAFSYPSSHILGFITPALTFNTFFAYIYTAFVLSIIDTYIKWLMN